MDADAALPEVLGTVWADLLIEAMLLFGPSYPSHDAARAASLDAGQFDDVLERLDATFLRLELFTPADARMTTYLAAGGGPGLRPSESLP